MKQFACGDVVPGCNARWACSTEEQLLAHIIEHARVDHGLVELPDELVAEVKARILTLA
jgi:predicted small metal-binding protein